MTMNTTIMNRLRRSQPELSHTAAEYIQPRLQPLTEDALYRSFTALALGDACSAGKYQRIADVLSAACAEIVIHPCSGAGEGREHV